MNKSVYMLLLASAAMSLSACGGEQPEPVPTETQDPTVHDEGDPRSDATPTDGNAIP